MKQSPVLDLLREHKGLAVSGEDISAKLGVSRSAVWKEMQNLRRLGYEIEAQPHLGYRLLSIPDKMFADEITYRLGTQIVGKSVYSYDAVDSTNDAAFGLGEKGAKEGACVFAEYQKKGRGRRGRSWVSPKGKNLILSVLLRPKLSPGQVSRITLMAGVSAVRAIRSVTSRGLGIKWPNDILYQDKKVGGILTEMSAEPDEVHFVVVGIGININADPSELPPGSTSLKAIAGRAVDRPGFARALLRELDADYKRFRGGNFQALARSWEDYSATSGKRVVAAVQGRKVQGQATGIDEDGALWIRKDDGLQERILAGDIEHLR
ncbi:MAG: biotin--[acetyl-CoA-carboxylase] ligase [Candidatus Omnitrophota bacterium]